MPRLQGRIDEDGATLIARVELGEAEAAYLRGLDRVIPTPFATTALIDTGASHTAIAPMVLAYLGVSPRGHALALVPGQPKMAIRTHDVRIGLGTHEWLFEVQAVGVMPATTSVLILIGRDILDRCTLLYDGPNREFSLTS